MKKIIALAIAAGAFALPTPALADHVGVIFDTRGQCESFLAGVRNDARAQDEASDGRFNRDYRDDFYCMEMEDGRFITARG